MFTSLTILTLQTIIFASASTPGSGGYVPGFKVHACSSSVAGVQNVSSWWSIHLKKSYRETVSQHLLWVTQCLHWQAFSPPQLLAGKDQGLPYFVFSLFFFTFQVCHVLRRLLVHSIYRPAASSKVKKIRTKNKKSEPTRKKDNLNQQEQDLSEPTRKKDNLN